jgi:LRR receptor-like serine/threonine-protein kinase FLS2
LQTNSFHGHIPDNICGPGTNLHVLSLRGNRLSGPATSVTRCSELTALDLSANKLTGSLPATAVRMGRATGHGRGEQDLQLWGGVMKLRSLPVPNQPTTGRPSIIDSCLGSKSESFSVTIHINLKGAGWCPPLSPSPKNWTKLVSLLMGNNRFGGTLPEEIYLIPILSYLDISSNM